MLYAEQLNAEWLHPQSERGILLLALSWMSRTWPISPRWTTPKATPSARTPTGTKKRDSNMQRPIMTSRSFLRTPSEAAGPGDEATIQDLVDTLEANRSRCVGMAANMIGVGKRIIVFVDEDLGGRITVMLNPVITASDGAFDTQEGCLSLTGERRTLRYRRIEVNYENRRFRARHATFAGWTAQIIQHEVDHCNGIII